MLTDWLRRLRHRSPNSLRQIRKPRRGRGASGQPAAAVQLLEPRVLLTAFPLGGEFKVNTYTTSQQRTYPESARAVATDANGNYVVTWSSYAQDNSGFGVYAQRYDALGTKQGAEFRVNATTINDQLGSAVAMDSSGDFVITWTSSNQDGSFDGIYARRYNAAGVAQGNEFLVNTFTNNSQRHASVAMDNVGNFVVTWTSFGPDGGGDGIFGQRYDATGAAQGGEFQVNTYTTSTQGRSSVAMDADGDFVVTWGSGIQDSGGYGVYAQRYNAAGVQQGSEFRVNAIIGGTQRDPSVDMDTAGNFVVVYSSNPQDGSGYGVYAQRFDATGVTLGSEFRVNSFVSGFQGNAAVALDGSGDFAVTWTSANQDGSGYGIYAKTYDSGGVVQNAEYRVNTFTTNNQRYSSIAMDQDGDFVVAWSSSAQDGNGYGVYAQQFIDFTAPLDINLFPTSIAENQPAGTVVGTLTSVDQDVGDTFTYTLVPGTGSTDNASFIIVGDKLQTAASFNFEVQNSYDIRIRSTDQAGLFFEKTFTITVTDVQEDPPTDIALIPASIPENRPVGTTVGLFSTSDPNAGDTFTYTLVGGMGSTDNGSFSIVGNQLRSATIFNFEVKNSYDIRVRTTDQTGFFYEEAFTVAVTDLTENPPTNLALSANFVAENKPIGTTVGSFTTTDPDVTDTFTYSLVTGTGSTDNASFSIVGNQLRTAAVFNFEVKSSYSVRVRSTDPAGLTIENVFAISVLNINEVPTVTLTNKVATLSEATSTAVALRVADIVVTDDGTGTNFLSLAGADAGLFEIFGNQLRLKAGATLDYETNPALDVTVQIDDDTIGGFPDGSAAYSLLLTNANELPQVDLINPLLSIQENVNTTSPIPVATIQLTDDALGIETLSLSGDDADLFEIIGNQLRIKAGAVIDFESTDDVLNVAVNVDDASLGGSPDDTAELMIQVIDVNEAPTLLVQPLTSSLPENTSTAQDRLVANVYVNDDALGTNTLSLSGFGATSFKLTNGQLFLKAGTKLDFETASSLSVTVLLNDPTVGASPDGSYSFRLTITDVNEAPVVPPKSFSLSTRTPRGTLVGTVTATDQDSGQILTYTIVGGNNENAFAINSTTGQITVANPRALRQPRVFALNVRATDNGSPAAFGQGIMTITVSAPRVPAPVIAAKPAAARTVTVTATVTPVTASAAKTAVPATKSKKETAPPVTKPAATSLLSRVLTAIKPKAVAKK